MTSSSTSSSKSDEPAVNPDEPCSICSETRENHGDKHHKFNTEGHLIPLDPPPKPRAEAPVHVSEAIKAASFATLMEVLVEKEILTAKDVIRVFGGNG